MGNRLSLFPSRHCLTNFKQTQATLLIPQISYLSVNLSRKLDISYFLLTSKGIILLISKVILLLIELQVISP